MNSEASLVTSPMMFGYRSSNGRLGHFNALNGARLRLTDQRGAQIMLAFLEPRSIASAQDEGFTLEEIEEARAAGLIVSEQECARVGLWERAGWSRAAYLMFTQTNLDYVEAGRPMNDRNELTGRRRSAVQEYERVGGYPKPEPIALGPQVELPAPTEIKPALAALMSRRSVRAFARRPPDAAQLADILHATTASHRLVAADRASGDPFRLLNSLYSWAHLFVVVQEVAGVPAGVFEYDWAGHRLLSSAPPPPDEELIACVQGQRWVLGPGFAIFVVAELRGYAWLYRHSRAYVHVLIQLGELGQEILMAGGARGLGGWTSPAVHESRTATMLGLPDDDGIEPLLMVKLGLPVHRGREA